MLQEKKYIKNFLKNITEQSGVYLMRDIEQKIIYVGKAKNLKKRVLQYFQKTKQSSKNLAMIAKISDVEVLVTQSETDALLLENDLIKTHKPRFNVLLKDDKSYPFIHISNEKHPKVEFFRGIKNKNGDYFGPFTSALIVKDSLAILQKIFKIRSCKDNIYKNRSRPCLEYQINNCTAPCCNKISDSNYNQDVDMMRMFLSGKGSYVLKNIANKMNKASYELNFELAGYYRDQIIGLRKMQEQHSISSKGNIDIIYCASEENVYCIQILFIRNSKVLGQEHYFPKNTKYENKSEILQAFIPQYYLNKKKTKNNYC